MSISEAERRIDFPDSGGSISIRSTHSPDLLRGAGLDFAVLDEAAYMLPDVWSEVVRPMLLERQGHALFISTPRGHNWFWELFQLGLDPLEPDWEAFHFRSSANPLVLPGELESIRRITPERVYREEYEAAFVDDAGQVFRRIRDAIITHPVHQPDARIVFGVDWGREHDYTVICALDANTGAMVAMDRFNQIGWEMQRGRLKAMAERFRPSDIWAEANSIGAVNIEALQAEGLPVRPFYTTQRSKAQLIESLALSIERGEVGVLNDPVLLAELSAYTLERLPSGLYRYNAPSGGHDDTVIALGLAWYGAQIGGIKLDFV